MAYDAASGTAVDMHALAARLRASAHDAAALVPLCSEVSAHPEHAPAARSAGVLPLVLEALLAHMQDPVLASGACFGCTALTQRCLHRRAMPHLRQMQGILLGSCGFCGAAAGPAAAALKKCGGCRAVAYCSTACQRHAWVERGHPALCAAAAAAARAAASHAASAEN
jgi:hypothetical protein